MKVVGGKAPHLLSVAWWHAATIRLEFVRLELRLQVNGIQFSPQVWILLTIAHRALHIDLQGEVVGNDLFDKTIGNGEWLCCTNIEL